MTINEKQAQILRETAAKLIKQADELEAGIDRAKCKYGEYTNERFGSCKTCGSPKMVICSNKKIIGKKRNGKLCNAANCRYFSAGSAGRQTGILKFKKKEKAGLATSAPGNLNT